MACNVFVMECALQRKNKVWIYLSNEDPGISQDKQAKLGIKTHHVSHHNYETENSTCRVLSEKKTRSCSNPNYLFVMSVSLYVHCHFIAGVGSVQQQEQPFIFWGLLFCWSISEKFCTSKLSCRSLSSAFTLGTYYLVLLSAGWK